MSFAEDSDFASSQSSPPKSNSSPVKEERSRERMFSGTLTVHNDEEWMLTRKAKLTLEELIETLRSYPPFREDQTTIKEEDGTWLVVTSWSRRRFFESQGCSWAFDCQLNLPPRDTSDFGSVIGFVQLVRDSFVATAGRQEQWPSGIKFRKGPLCPNHSVDDAQVGNVGAEPLGRAPYARQTGWQQRV